MTGMTRRSLLAGTTAAAAVATLPASSHAAAPASGKQAPAYYRFKVGSFELTAVHDGVWNRKIDPKFVGGAAWPDVQKAMQDAFMKDDTLVIPFTALVVNTGSKLVAIDTATGAQLAPTAGSYMANLAAAGIDPKQVDTVLISHFHPDHINGLRDKEGNLVFPNAEVQVPSPEWAWWMDDSNMNKQPEAARPAWMNARRVFKGIEDKVVKFEPGKEQVPGITSMHTPGHTPGHTSYIVASGNQSMMVLGDLTNNPYLFVRNPDWQAAFDTDGKLAAETRHKVLERVSIDKTMVQGYHFPFPASGYITKTGPRGYDLVPVMWQPSL